MSEGNFNPLAKVFDKPEGGVGAAEFAEMAEGLIHTTGLYGDEGLQHGGEKIDPATGRPNDNKYNVASSTLAVREAPGGKDMMGDIPDPNTMTLEELMKSQ